MAPPMPGPRPCAHGAMMSAAGNCVPMPLPDTFHTCRVRDMLTCTMEFADASVYEMVMIHPNMTSLCQYV